MKSGRRKILLAALGFSALLAIVAALALSRWVDAESYRDLLRSNLSRQLGREVEFGAMELSLWPVLGLRLDDLVIGRAPAERFDKPVVAESLRVGARLFPLLRGRLDVTSLIVEGPVLSLYRRADGTWEPALPSAGNSGRSTESGGETALTDPAQAISDGPPLVIEQLRVRRARVVVRWDDAGRLRETTLDDMNLSLDGLGTNGPVAFDLTASVGVSGTLRGSGRIQWAYRGTGPPLEFSGRVETEDLAPPALREWVAVLAPTMEFPEDLLADRPVSASATLDYVASRPARLAISDATVRGPGLSLVRSASGVWNYGSLIEPSDAAQTEAPGDLSIHVSGMTIDEASVRVEDRSAHGEPAVFELSSLRLDLRQSRPDVPIEIDLDATGGIEGRAVLKGRLIYEPAKDASPGRVRGAFEATDVDPRDLRPATTLASFPAALVVGRRFGMSAEIDATLADTPEVTLRSVTLRNLDLAMEREATGTWDFARQPPTGKPTPMSKGTSSPSLRTERVELTDASLRLTDRTAAGVPAVLNLSALRLFLDRLPTAGPTALELDAQVGSGKDAKLAFRGKVGPLGDDMASMPVDLSIKLTAIALADLSSLLPAMENLDISRATAAADLRVAGTFTRQLDVTGDLSLSRGTVSFVSPQGDARTLPFDLRARGEVLLRDSAARIELPSLELELPRGNANRVLTLRGSVSTASGPPIVDLTLLRTRVAADDLAALAALFAPNAPLSFSSPDPVELELRARGPLGDGALPDLEGRATLSGFTFRVAGMTQPMERVGAKVTFSPNRIALEEFGGVIGKSDVTASRVVVTNFAAPKVQVTLNSRSADFWELFSFIESAETPVGATPAVGSDPLSRLTIEGTLGIERGSLQTLTFDTLTTGMDFRGGVLTLAPLEMNLYGGRFAGKLVQDLDAGVLAINGNGVGVDADGFLAQNLALGGLISGRASTELNVRVGAADPANLLAGVSGGGPLQLADGRIAKLDVLKSLSKVTGIFGERSLQRLTKQLATVDTPFRHAETTLRFDSGTLVFEDLVIETAELTLAGRAALESATGKLEGRFAVAFSPELSAAMREERSRAAGLFWDAKSQRVSFGFDVGGQATAPKVSVDWDSALRGVAERKLGERIRGLVDRKSGGGATGGVTPAADATMPTPSTPGEGAVPPANSPPTGLPPDSAAAGTDSVSSGVLPTPSLAAEITRTGWAGPVLLRDLSVEGHVRGVGIQHAALSVVDARGIEVQKIERLRPVDDQLALIEDPDVEVTIPWSARIDGKRLLAARFPVKITVTLYDRQGRSASVTRDVGR